MGEQESEEITVEDLELHSIIGFDGGIIRGFVVHPNGEHVVYPLGNKISIQHWATKKQDFLSGHTNTISAVAVSPSGKYIASGQINHIGFKAKVILWDFDERCLVAEHEIHKVRVESICFSINDRYLISLGGRDCGSIVVWDVESRQPLCGNQASSGTQGDAVVVYPTNKREACFISGGECTLQIWKIDREARNVRGINITLAKLKRLIMCIDLNERDEICYCGTSTGDVLKIRLNFHHDVEVLDPVKRPILMGSFSKHPQKPLPEGCIELYSQGIRAIKLIGKEELLIGGGDGTIDIVQERRVHIKPAKTVAYKLCSTPELFVLKSTKINGIPTSFNIFQNDQLFVGTNCCELYSINLTTFQTVLLITCHKSTIFDVAFPYHFSEVFATASQDDVRIWSVATQMELLRICVPNFICCKVVFAHDGKSIYTGWNDGVIRAFTPLTGRLIFAIPNSHNKGVSALAVTHHGRTLISGGCEGQVRLWKITPLHNELMCVLKEHKGPVSAVHINASDDEAASASTDGTCIIWDVIRQVRKQILFGNTLFMCVRYFPTGVQIVTAGSDRKVAYWEVLDGTLVRELEGSTSGAINCIDIIDDGTRFVTGGNDQIIKLWDYEAGITTHVGLGHSAVITAAAFSPDGKYIVSTSASGSIFIWSVPKFVPRVFLESDENVPDGEGKPDETAKTEVGDGGGAGDGTGGEAVENINDIEKVEKNSRDGSVKSRKICGCPKNGDDKSIKSHKSNASNHSKVSNKSKGSEKSKGSKKN
ncbi:cilia- and flagella-associated protein 52 [Onthophagus taurus]|uniref:cilia- and flagella-associated protein 52 n=1 Tax=Onthophagus taurus TaxID=166361 RepID=UPI0039BE55AB